MDRHRRERRRRGREARCQALRDRQLARLSGTGARTARDCDLAVLPPAASRGGGWLIIEDDDRLGAFDLVVEAALRHEPAWEPPLTWTRWTTRYPSRDACDAAAARKTAAQRASDAEAEKASLALLATEQRHAEDHRQRACQYKEEITARCASVKQPPAKVEECEGELSVARFSCKQAESIVAVVRDRPIRRPASTPP